MVPISMVRKFHAVANWYVQRITTYCTCLTGVGKIVEGSMCSGSLLQLSCCDSTIQGELRTVP